MLYLSKELPVEVAATIGEVIDHNGAYDVEVYMNESDYPENVKKYIAQNIGLENDVSVRMAFYVEGKTVTDIGFLVYGFDGKDDEQLPDEKRDIERFIKNKFPEYIKN